jgi:hypothetical protein
MFHQKMNLALGSPAKPSTTMAPVEKSEAEKYWEMTAPDEGTDILQWWADHEKQLPRLSYMARQ